MTTGTIDPRYGNAAATPPPWPAIERLLTDAQLYWIITVRADGRPHAVPLVDVWHDLEVSSSGGSTEGGAWVYTVAPAKVIAFGGEHGQTTYRF